MMSQKEFICINECAQKYAANRGMDLLQWTDLGNDLLEVIMGDASDPIFSPVKCVTIDKNVLCKQ